MKALEIEVLTTEWGVKLLRIKHQEYRGDKFYNNTYLFRASNDFTLNSDSVPAAIPNGFYVCGNERERKTVRFYLFPLKNGLLDFV